MRHSRHKLTALQKLKNKAIRYYGDKARHSDKWVYRYTQRKAIRKKYLLKNQHKTKEQPLAKWLIYQHKLAKRRYKKGYIKRIKRKNKKKLGWIDIWEKGKRDIGMDSEVYDFLKRVLGFTSDDFSKLGGGDITTDLMDLWRLKKGNQEPDEETEMFMRKKGHI